MPKSTERETRRNQLEATRRADTEWNTFRAVRMIMDRLEVQPKENPRTEINILDTQTQEGVLLVCYWDCPKALWTPWGSIDISSGKRGQYDYRLGHPGIVDTMETYLYQALDPRPWGDFRTRGPDGPIFGILEIDNIRLPKAVLDEIPYNQTKYNQKRDTWMALAARYQTEIQQSNNTAI